METVEIFGLKFVSSDNFDDVLNKIFDENQINNAFLPIVATPNLDQLVQFSKQEEIFKFIQKSFLILPDGQPIVWSSKIIDKQIKSRLSGSDLFPLFWQKAKKLNKKVLCITPTDESATLLKKDFLNSYYYTPPFFDIKNNDIVNEIVSDICQIITNEKIDFVVVGLSLPKREIIAMRIIDNLKIKLPVILLLGAAFEFYLGIKVRAPTWIRKLGFEWFHRFLSEPRRLFKRYFIVSWYFLYLIYIEKRKKK